VNTQLETLFTEDYSSMRLTQILWSLVAINPPMKFLFRTVRKLYASF
jgi:hypothetical protein